MKNFKIMKNLIEVYEIAKANADAIEDAWSNEPENEKLEKAFDEAYREQFTAAENLINEIVKTTSGAVDAISARKIITTNLEDLKTLVNRAA